MNNNNKILLHLSLIDGIGSASINSVVRFIAVHQKCEASLGCIEGSYDRVLPKKLDLSVVYHMTGSEFLQAGLKREQADVLVAGLRDTKRLNEEVALLEKHRYITFFTLLDAQYPDALRHITAPPPILYCHGIVEADVPSRLAIVGARLADTYAQQVIDMIVPEMVMQGWQIVSGGARGADTMAHHATVKACGKTIAVLGSGLLQPYPTSNKKLFTEIVNHGGAVISPFFLQAPPERFNFPARNRIIAGLSSGCLVIQAAAKSGALITAEFALEQGRHVFAVPGSIFHPLSAGTNKLLGMGAKVVSSARDILEEFGHTYDKNDEKKQQSFIIDATFIEKKNKNVIADDADILTSALQKAASIDELSIITGMDVVLLQDKLFMLQLEGKVQQTFSGLWERVSI